MAVAVVAWIVAPAVAATTVPGARIGSTPERFAREFRPVAHRVPLRRSTALILEKPDGGTSRDGRHRCETAAMTDRPSGTVTFLFTDIEGSTRRWEADADAMRVALAAHDDVLRAALEGNGGWLFKHTGDGVCAAFSSARAAVDAAIEAQRLLRLPVRMGIATGEAEQRGDDYFGPVLNRAARVMAVGHGGQILVAQTTASLLDGVGLVDLGEHRLRDLSGAHRLFQVRADGLGETFPALQTLDAVPGNLPVLATSFVGRDVEVKELCELVRAHRLVTLTGVGGVGKTRLGVQVAAELTGDFGDGVWMIELAPVGDPAAVPDAVTTGLGVTPQAGMSVTAAIAHALVGRQVLLVVDNCEHVLDAAADLIEAILERASTVKVIATSREGLRVGGEQLWSVPSLGVGEGANSAAVELFVERARAVKAGFALTGDADTAAVTEICTRLDGIALAIELAAARMVSMKPQDVRDRLGDRFRLLSGSRRALERHQTLRHAVGWSYDLLSDDERTVLQHCSVFAGGFDLTALTDVCARFDDYVVLDLLDSLVRKSLVTMEESGSHARYGLLETIRQFAEDQLAATGSIDDVRDRHAHYYAGRVVAYWDLWEGPRYRDAADWVDAELANLRAGFRWAADRSDLVTAAAIAAHTAVMAFLLMVYEPIGWAEEVLPAATTADIAQLPRLYTAAGRAAYIGRLGAGVEHARTALRLAVDDRYDPFHPAHTRLWAANAEVFAGGDVDRYVEEMSALAGYEAGQTSVPADQSGRAQVIGLAGLLYTLPVAGRAEEARALAAQALDVTRAHANPVWIALTLLGVGRAFADTDPPRALDAVRQALVLCQEQRIPYWETRAEQVAASLETLHGDPDKGLDLFDTAITSYDKASNRSDAATVLAALAVYFAGAGQPETAATLYGTTSEYPITHRVANLPATLEHLRTTLGQPHFEECVATGAAMRPGDAVAFARQQIRNARARLCPSR